MATLKDIAEACGTSAATVSYVLSGRGTEKRISAQMQKQITDAAEKLDYKRKVHSKASLKYRMFIYFPLNDLKMILPSFWDGFNSAVNLETENIDIVLRPFRLNELNMQRDLWNASEHSSAVVVSPSGFDLANLSEIQTAIPVILLNRTLPNYASVSFDQLESGQMAAKHALKKGGKDIMLVTYKSLFGVTWRGNAIADYCTNHGVSLTKSTFYVEPNVEAGYEFGKKLVQNGKLAKVIVCAYDMTALGISAALTESGIIVGKDVQILATSSSDKGLFAHASPPMTVVDLRFKDVCQMAVRLGIDIATGRASYPQDISIHPVMIYRQSCPY